VENEPSVYEWIGGRAALERMAQIFYEKYVPHDPLLGPLFAQAAPDHAQRVALWLGEVFGGPKAYSDDFGGYSSMLSRHLGRALTEEKRARWVELLVASANDAGLPNDAEFRSVLSGYIEWGSRIAVENSQAGATPPPAMPMPHWEWHTSPGAPGSRTPAGPSHAPVASEGMNPEGEDDPAPEGGGGVSFRSDIKPLIREADRDGMKWAFDLWSYDEVREHADTILARLSAGTMPPDGPWSASRVALFERWIDEGKAP